MTQERGRGGLAFRNPLKRQGWAQIYHVLTLDQDLSDGAFRLYVLLLKYARRDTECWPGRERLAQDLGTTTRTIDRRLGELVEHGLITRTQRGKGKTAMTWIEDLEAVYGADDSSPDKNVEAASPDKSVGASPDKNVGAMTPTNLSGKEHAEEETDKKGAGGTTKDKATKTILLTAFGVSRPVAVRLAAACDLEEIRGWLAYARRADGLYDPVAFVVARLQDGEEPPAAGGNGQDDDRRRYVTGKYAEFIQS